MRPLDFLGRIKVKLGLLIVAALAVAFFVYEVLLTDLARGWRIAVAVALGLAMVQVLAWGMTRPLREMARAAQIVAKGRYDLRVRATSRDEVGELARAFNAMAADLGAVDRQRRELVANASHELRTPITGLRAVLENVIDGISPPEALRTALAQTERLGRLAAQLLDLSRLESGARLIEEDEVELAALVRQAVEEAAPAREDVRVEMAVPRGLVVLADPDLLAQVLANLLDNAVRHSPAGGVVTVRADERELVVADEGRGIPESARARVFERFSRLDAARAADAGGAGLGLAIVKEIVELHGGSIHIGDGPGCRMVVALPGRLVMALDGPQDAELGKQPSPTEPPATDPGPASPATSPAASAAGSSAASPTVSAAASPAGEPVAAGLPAGAAPTTPAVAPSAAQPADPSTGPSVGPSTGPSTEPSTGPAVGPVPAGSPTDLVTVPAGVGAATGPGPDVRPAGPDEAGAGAEPRVPGVPGVPGGPRVAGVPGGPGSPSVPGVPAVPPVPVLRAGETPVPGLARVVFGGLLGSVVGFILGMVAAVFAVVAIDEEGAGAVALVLVTLGGAVVGAAAGASSRARVYQQATTPPPPPGQPLPPYVPPPLFPRPDLPDTPRWLLPAAAGAGVFGAIALPESQAGLGLVLTFLVLAGAAVPAALKRMTPWTAALGAVALALVAVAAWRDATWYVLPALALGCAVAALAISGAGAGWLGVIRGAAAALLSLAPAPWFLAEPLRRPATRKRLLPAVGAVGITTVLLLVFGALFASADAVFASFVERVLATPEWAESIPGRLVVFVLIAVLLASVVLVALRPINDPASPSLKLKLSPSLWMLPLTALNLLFGVFVVLQIAVLFGGAERVVRTAGLTYAEYARQGFFQLAVVSFIVLAIVTVASVVVRARGRARLVLAAELGTLCALTLVILFSALHRMDLYTEAYGLSRLRISVQAAIWWLAAIFALVLIAGAVRLAGRGTVWLPRTVVLVSALGLVGFAAVDPEARVAESQVARGVDRVDYGYLRDLGADAVPALDRLPEPQRSCLLREIATGVRKAPEWNSWNLARVRAHDVLVKRPIVESASCPSR
ncbi:DUF4153 domain-containing protein [Nonomuraea sp. NPDC050310]|uniref:DUF4153 domain-containing protein n=1 Tax=Nonomuraea sp. NPDC050310 TaxID=3154935 RepID=UPI0033E7BB53